MSHMWPVPGWESRWGLFSSEHPDLGGRIGDIDALRRPPTKPRADAAVDAPGSDPSPVVPSTISPRS